MLHSNPMDYAWGANGLDAIITQVCTMFFFHMEIEINRILYLAFESNKSIQQSCRDTVF